MPAAPPAIFVPATGGGAPSAPGAIFVPATGGGAPTAPPVIFSPAGAGGAPAAPGGIFLPPVPNAPGMRISGTSGANGDLASIGDADLDGFEIYNGATQQIYHSGGNWVIAAAGYGAFKASAAATPAGLTDWTITSGTGQPTILALLLPAPAGIFVPATGGGAPSAPAAVFSPAGSGGAPAAPAAVFSPAGGGGAPSAPGGVFVPDSHSGDLLAPPPIFGMDLYSLYGPNYQPLTIGDTPLSIS